MLIPVFSHGLLATLYVLSARYIFQSIAFDSPGDLWRLAISIRYIFWLWWYIRSIEFNPFSRRKSLRKSQSLSIEPPKWIQMGVHNIIGKWGTKRYIIIPLISICIGARQSSSSWLWMIVLSTNPPSLCPSDFRLKGPNELTFSFSSDAK